MKGGATPTDPTTDLPGEVLDRIIGTTRDSAITQRRNDGITSSLVAIVAGQRWGADYRIKASVEGQARLAGIQGVALPMARNHHDVSPSAEAWAQTTYREIANRNGLVR